MYITIREQPPRNELSGLSERNNHSKPNKKTQAKKIGGKPPTFLKL